MSNESEMTLAYPIGSPGKNPWLDVIRKVVGENGLNSGACQFGKVLELRETKYGSQEVYIGALVDHYTEQKVVTITARNKEAWDELRSANEQVKQKGNQG